MALNTAILVIFRLKSPFLFEGCGYVVMTLPWPKQLVPVVGLEPTRLFTVPGF